jgi:integrase
MINQYTENGKIFYEVFVKGRDAQGKQIGRRKKTIASEAKAKRIEFEFKKELESMASGEVIWTWKTWHEECLRRMQLSWKKKTVENYDLQIRKWVSKSWDHRELLSFTKADVHQIVFETIADLATPHTQQDVHRRVMRIFELAVEEGILPKNPARGIKVRVGETKQSVLNANEAEILLKTAKETNHRFYPVWALALMTGMRSGELYALRWSDVDFEAELVSVTKQWTSKDGLHPTKNGRNRVVPISSEFGNFLKGLKLQGGHKAVFWDGLNKVEVSFDDLILPRLSEWTDGFQAQVLLEFCESIGITKVKFHDLRATFITNLLAQGAPLVAVMSIVGHSRMSTTDKYLRLAGVGIKGVTGKLGYSLPRYEGGKLIPLFSQK